MRKDVYLFRHGQTDANKEHRWQGCGINLSLNEEGRVNNNINLTSVFRAAIANGRFRKECLPR